MGQKKNKGLVTIPQCNSSDFIAVMAQNGDYLLTACLVYKVKQTRVVGLAHRKL